MQMKNFSNSYKEAKAHALELMNDNISLTSIYEQAREQDNRELVDYVDSWFNDRIEEVRSKFAEEVKNELDHGIDSYTLEDYAAQLRRIEECIDDTDFEGLEYEADKLGLDD